MYLTHGYDCWQKKLKKKKMEITNWQLGLDSMESIEIEIDTDSPVINLLVTNDTHEQK